MKLAYCGCDYCAFLRGDGSIAEQQQAFQEMVRGGQVFREALDKVIGEDMDILDVKFESDVDEVFNELASLLKRKHHDYGPRNIADAPGGALNGVLVRMWDKMARIRNLVEQEMKPAQNEPLEDSFSDLANYAVIALLIMGGKWPGVDRP